MERIKAFIIKAAREKNLINLKQIAEYLRITNGRAKELFSGEVIPTLVEIEGLKAMGAEFPLPRLNAAFDDNIDRFERLTVIACTHYGYTLKDVANALKITNQHLSLIRGGSRNVQKDHINTLKGILTDTEGIEQFDSWRSISEMLYASLIKHDINNVLELSSKTGIAPKIIDEIILGLRYINTDYKMGFQKLGIFAYTNDSDVATQIQANEPLPNYEKRQLAIEKTVDLLTNLVSEQNKILENIEGLLLQKLENQ